MKIKEIVEFGDFQTPLTLAKEVVSNIQDIDKYKKIIEPTCGVGAFIIACLNLGIKPTVLEGWEINPYYVELANNKIKALINIDKDIVSQEDFYSINWDVIGKNTDAVLYLGNPPWVTSSELGKILSKNIPNKNNFQTLNGLDAITGKSNFDISEWMLIKLMNIISDTNSSIAFLIKTAVARKLFSYAAQHNLKLKNFSIKKIDAKFHFNVSVDACLFTVDGSVNNQSNFICNEFKTIEETTQLKKIGYINNKLIANIELYNSLKHIDKPSNFKWRSGIKHDSSKVMEFTQNEDGTFTNGFLEIISLPKDFLYPMYKSSDISKECIVDPRKYMLVTQNKIGDDTSFIKDKSPETWAYLMKKHEFLDKRKSSIYKKNPRFSIFGVGEYTFKPWKIAISGLYKNIKFSKVGLFGGKPIVLDDTCYILSFDQENKANFVYDLLNSEICKNYINSLVFLDNKRPITVALLNRINIKELAIHLGFLNEYLNLFVLENKQKEFIFS